MIRLMLAFLAAIIALPVLGQGTMQQAGPVVARHIPGVIQNGYYGDSGFASGFGPNNGVGVGIAEQLLIAPSAPSGQGGSNWCDYDFPVTNPAGYHYLCLSPNAGGTGAALIVGAGGGATQLPLSFIVNGITYPFPFGTSAGVPPWLGVADTAALQALSVVPLAVTTKVRVGTYSLANRQFSPPVDYFLTQTACVVDAGSCFAAATSGYYWQITPQTVWDARWWGAYEDVNRINGMVNISATCAVNAVAGTFTSADIGKRIVITDAITSNPNGATYWSTISAVGNATNITVAAPCPTFTTAQSQYIYYGHDDAAAWNNAAIYMTTIAPGGTALGGQPVLSGSGHASGVYSSSVNIFANMTLANAEFVALGADNLPLATSGVINYGAAFFYAQNVIADGAWLPVNPCYSNANGSIFPSNLRCKNWLGFSPIPTILSGVSTNIEAITTGSIGSCTGTTLFTCTYTVTAIGSTGLTSSAVGAGGSGYVAGDLIYLTQSGGTQTQQAVARVTNVSSGAVTGFTIAKSGLFTSNPTSFSQASTSGAGTGFTITSPTFATSVVQPGQALSDGAANLSNGSYVTAFGTGTGGLGTYTIQNGLTNPCVSGATPCTVGSQTIRTIGLDLTVTANGALSNIGLVSRGNSATGIPDRSFAVAWFANQVTMNKAPTKEFSNATIVLNQDSNGFYMGPLAGLQISNMTISQDDFQTIISNHYGCALRVDGAGGTTFSNITASFGIANVCEGASATNVWFANKTVTTGASASGTIELNSPTLLLMDGASVNLVENFNTAGQVQIFAITPGSNTTLSILSPVISNTFGGVLYAPNNTIWYYTEQNNLSTNSLVLSQPMRNTNISAATPNHAILTSGSAGSYQQFSPSQLAAISQSPAVNLSPNSSLGSPMFTNGLNLNTTPLYGAEQPYVQITGNQTIPETDVGKIYDITAAAVLTIPNSLGSNSVGGFLKSGFSIPSIVSRTGSPVSISAASGTTLYYQGQSQSSVTLQEFYPYSLSCPRNVTAGNGAICFLSLTSGFVSGGLPTVAAGAAAGTSPTVTLANTPTDAAMTLSALTGSATTTGVLATVTFGQTWPNSEVPKCQLSPRNAAAGDLTTPKVWGASTNSTIVFHVDTSALATTTTYLWDILCQ